MDLRRTLEISQSTGMRGLASRYGPLGEFHKRRKLSAGKWKYMGHIITKNPKSDIWRATPDVLYACQTDEIFKHYRPDKIMRTKTKDAIVWALYHHYIELAVEVIEIENERRKNTR